uniref:hypothetical protein n=1 Tax=Anaerobiospirillum succiniciproducens TaxID=13335 RepID=UPI00248DC329
AQKSANEQAATTAPTPSAETAQAADNEQAHPDAEPKTESENNASEPKIEAKAQDSEQPKKD